MLGFPFSWRFRRFFKVWHCCWFCFVLFFSLICSLVGRLICVYILLFAFILLLCVRVSVCYGVSVHVFGNVLALDLSYADDYAHVHTIIHLNVSILYTQCIQRASVSSGQSAYFNMVCFCDCAVKVSLLPLHVTIQQCYTISPIATYKINRRALYCFVLVYSFDSISLHVYRSTPMFRPLRLVI